MSWKKYYHRFYSIVCILLLITLQACGSSGGDGDGDGDGDAAGNTPPDTSISIAPAALTNSSSASFTFTSTEAESTFQCFLDGGALDSCTSPDDYTELAEGEHSFSVQATDAAGNTDTTAATHNWFIDLTSPDTSISSSPNSITNSTSVSFEFTSTEESSTFQCTLDGAELDNCNSPDIYAELAEGDHSFSVQATDAAGNVDITPGIHNWSIDLTPPDTSISTAPALLTNSTSASFLLSSTEAGSTFLCALDGGALVNCGSPYNFSGVAAGNHSFRVHAIDAAGNTDATPATYNWLIDLTPPDTSISSSPDSLTNSTDAFFNFTSTETGSTFQCFLDNSDLTSCNSPINYASLAEGNHSFSVVATDAAGNTDASPASYNWSVDLTPPDTSISSTPDSLTNSTNASFDFSATETGSTFQCSLDGGALSNCSSPNNYAALAEGDHTVSIEATDAAGNTDATPATYNWFIDLTPPDTSISNSPDSLTNSTDAIFNFTSTETGSTFQCYIDDAVLTNCSSPKDYAGLAEGNQRFSVEATDAAGNTDPTPEIFDWTIDLTPPVVSVPGDITVIADDASGTPATDSTIQAFLNGTTATDNVDGDVTDNISDDAPATFPMGITTVTFSVTDTAGNTGSNSSTVEVVDTDNLPPDTTSIVINKNAQYAVSVYEFTARLMASDNIGVTAYLITEHNATDPGDIMPPYETPLSSDENWIAVTEIVNLDLTTQFPLAQSYSLGDTVELCAWFMDFQENISERVCDAITYGNDWESGIGNWSAENGVWQVGTPTAGPASCFSGSQCAGTVLDGVHPTNTDSRLVSATFELPTVTGIDEIHLRFQQWFSYGTSASGQVQIAVWDPDTAIWGDWISEGTVIVNVSGGWSLKDVDLTAYSGDTVRIGFLHSAANFGASFGWYIDDLTISVF
ncbi:MAG: HYR domain-containing protein [Pseudomonadales bacterium]|nr:HYR domain-containing protein [Pseudomonadales bacterium]